MPTQLPVLGTCISQNFSCLRRSVLACKKSRSQLNVVSVFPVIQVSLHFSEVGSRFCQLDPKIVNEEFGEQNLRELYRRSNCCQCFVFEVDFSLYIHTFLLFLVEGHNLILARILKIAYRITMDLVRTEMVSVCKASKMINICAVILGLRSLLVSFLIALFSWHDLSLSYRIQLHNSSSCHTFIF